MIIKNGELKNFISGAVYYEESDGLIPYRFSKKQIETSRDDINKVRHLTASGIKIDFISDTNTLQFHYTVYTEFSSLIYKLYYFDVYADGVLVLHQGEKDLTTDREGNISLIFKEGRKHITIYLPGSCAVKIEDFTIDDHAYIEQVSYDKNVYFFGDSITHTAYLEFPSLNYSNILSRKFRYNAVNQAIGGDIFDKNNLLYLPDFKADMIFVAYGTNDWCAAVEGMEENIDAYLEKLSSLFPDVQINVILPIWRRDLNAYPQHLYSFDDMRNIIKKTAEKYRMNVLDGFDFVPRDEKFYTDKDLHPNEMGFLFYADSLENEMKK